MSKSELQVLHLLRDVTSLRTVTINLQNAMWSVRNRFHCFRVVFFYSKIFHYPYFYRLFLKKSGFLVTYLTLKQIDSVRKRSTVQWAGFWSLFYFHRWWRLTPVYMAAMGIYALLMPHFGQGWNTEVIYEYIKSICRRQWWTHPLYINNLYPWPNVLDDSVSIHVN